jgi:tRNA (guanosine-2'-O-)-methyltransferase
MLHSNTGLIDYLSSFLTERRNSLIAKNLLHRTRYITIVLEDIYQPHNASAVLRTAECFGIQDIHIIENKNKYTLNPDVAMGSSKWLNLYKHNKLENNTIDAIKHLKANNYRVIATTPHENDCNLEDFDLSKGKIAVCFGTELTGLSKVFLDNADEFMKIPLYGFTESYNISVSAAIAMHHLTYKLRNSDIDWPLSSKEIMALKETWVKKSLKHADFLEKEYYRLQQKNKLQ